MRRYNDRNIYIYEWNLSLLSGSGIQAVGGTQSPSHTPNLIPSCLRSRLHKNVVFHPQTDLTQLAISIELLKETMMSVLREGNYSYFISYLTLQCGLFKVSIDLDILQILLILEI